LGRAFGGILANTAIGHLNIGFEKTLYIHQDMFLVGMMFDCFY
jgi:hypothetical protein